jgi:ribosomal protein S18 acetylase RimI-like enzyme
VPDLLVRLYDLPPLSPVLETVRSNGFEIRRALAPEKAIVLPWIAEHFSRGWAAECDVAFGRQPAACLLATRDGLLCGFAAYEATCRNFLGPLGVHPDFRMNQLGRALLLAALHAMYAEGYAYAVIGGAGPVEFFRIAVDATVIEGSSPGIYRGLLHPSSV